MPGIADQIRELVRSVTNLARRIRRLETLPAPLGVDRPTGGHIIQDEGDDLPDQVYLDFIGVGVTAEDDLENGKTTVKIPGAVQEIINTTIGASLDKIILIYRQGSGWSGFSVFEPTSDGFDSALTSANPGAVIYIPPVTINGDHTILADVEIWGAGRDKTIFSGTITMGVSSVLSNLSVTPSANDSNTLRGIIGAGSGIDYIFNCSIIVTQSGNGACYGIDQPNGGTTWAWSCNIEANSAGSFGGEGWKGNRSYGIHVQTGGTVVHRWCRVVAQTNGIDCNPFWDDDSSFAVDASIDTGAFPVTTEAGINLTGLVKGKWYCIENTGGPWGNGDIPEIDQFDWAISFDGGTTWEMVESHVDGEERIIWASAYCEHIETVGVDYIRVYFYAQSTSVRIRVGDGVGQYANNTGSMGYEISSATVTLNASDSFSADIENQVGAIATNQRLGDRGAYDIDDHAVKHASDIYSGIMLRHLPAPGNDGHVIYDDDDEWKSGTPEDAGIGVSDDNIFPADLYTEDVANNGYAANRTNSGQVRNRLASYRTGGTTYQAICFWDSDDYLVLGQRELDGVWTLYTYDGSGGLPTIQVSSTDAHLLVAIAIDNIGYIHVCYDMHDDALRYRRSNAAIDAWAGGLSNTLPMVGTNENSVTYPTFLKDPNGVLYITFRNLHDWYFYKYTTGTTSWAAATGTGAAGILIDGDGAHKAYLHYPVFDADFGFGGYMHWAFHWRDTGTAENEDVGYMKWDDTNWTQDGGEAQAIPVTTANDDTIDPVPQGDGLTSFGSVGSDSSNNPIIVYTKKGDDNYRHIFANYFNGVSWVCTQVTTSESEVVGDQDSPYLFNPLILVDRSTDIAYIFYIDHRDTKGLILQRSDAGDFTSWTRYVIYPENLGRGASNVDLGEWERNGVLYFFFAYWVWDQTELPIRTMKWVDTYDYILFEQWIDNNVSLEASSSNPYWEPAVDADGFDILFDADGDIAMVWVT